MSETLKEREMREERDRNYKENLKKVPQDLDLHMFFKRSLDKAVDRITPEIAVLLEKQVRNMYLDQQYKLNYSIKKLQDLKHEYELTQLLRDNEKSDAHAYRNLNKSIEPNYSKLKAPSHRDYNKKYDTATKQNRLQSSFLIDRDGEEVKIHDDNYLYDETMDNLKPEISKEMEKRPISSNQKINVPLIKKSKKVTIQKQGIESADNLRIKQDSNRSSRNQEFFQSQSNSFEPRKDAYSASKSNKSQQSRKSLMNNDIVIQEIKKKKKQDDKLILIEEIKPLISTMMDDFCKELYVDFPYLPCVIFQLLQLREKDDKVKQLLDGKKIKELQKRDPYFAIKLHPIETKHITDFNQNLIKENTDSNEKINELQEQINKMRKQYNRELNNRQTQELAQKRRLEKLERQGFLNKGDDAFDFQGIQLFDATDGIDPELAEILNQKIMKIKSKFTEWQVKQMEYTNLLKKKLYMYDSLASEFHGIVSMPLTEIFHGVKLMDEPADQVWDAMIENFGHEYLLPIIDKTYGHLFVNDTKRHAEKIAEKIEETITNEKQLFQQCKAQVKAMKEELDEQKYITVKERLSLTEEIKKAENKNYYIGYEKAQEESKIKIQELEKELNEYKDQHSHLQKLAHSDLQCLKQNMLRSAFTCFMLNAYAKQDRNKSKRYIDGQFNENYQESYHELQKTIQSLQQEIGYLKFEANCIKRERKHQIEEIEQLKQQNETTQSDLNRALYRLKNVREIACQEDEIECLRRNLQSQGELLSQVEGERDRIYKQTNQVPLAASKIDNMLKATTCIISFNGWKNLKDLKSIPNYKRDVNLITDIKGTWKSFEVISKTKQPTDPSDDQLAKLYDLPKFDLSVQTDNQLIEEYVIEQFPHIKRKKGKLKVNSSSNSEICNQAVQCTLFDKEQVDAFIFDNICNDRYLHQIINARRKYLNRVNMENADFQDFDLASQRIDEGVIGGIEVLEQYRLLSAEVKGIMVDKIDYLQQNFEVPVDKPKQIQGVFARLWADAGLKEERMVQMKKQIDSMIKDELMKKILLHKNRSNKQLMKNQLLLGNFMEQIHEFITKEIIEIELIQKEENKRNLILEGHNDGPAISPTKNRPLTPNMPRGRLDGSLKLKKKGLQLQDNQAFIDTAKEYIIKLKDLIKLKGGNTVSKQNRAGSGKNHNSQSPQNYHKRIAGQQLDPTLSSQERNEYQAALQSLSNQSLKNRIVVQNQEASNTYNDEEKGKNISVKIFDEKQHQFVNDSIATNQLPTDSARLNNSQSKRTLVAPNNDPYANVGQSQDINYSQNQNITFYQNNMKIEQSKNVKNQAETLDIKDRTIDMTNNGQKIFTAKTSIANQFDTWAPPTEQKKQEDIQSDLSFQASQNKYQGNNLKLIDKNKQYFMRISQDPNLKEQSKPSQETPIKNQQVPKDIRDMLMTNDRFGTPELVFGNEQPICQRPNSAIQQKRVFTNPMHESWKFGKNPSDLLNKSSYMNQNNRSSAGIFRSKHLVSTEQLSQPQAYGLDMINSSTQKQRLKGQNIMQSGLELQTKQHYAAGGGIQHFFTGNHSSLVSNMSINIKNQRTNPLQYTKKQYKKFEQKERKKNKKRSIHQMNWTGYDKYDKRGSQQENYATLMPNDSRNLGYNDTKATQSGSNNRDQVYNSSVNSKVKDKNLEYSKNLCSTNLSIENLSHAQSGSLKHGEKVPRSSHNYNGPRRLISAKLKDIKGKKMSQGIGVIPYFIN